MPQLNFADFPPQLIWLACTFFFLYLVLARFILPRIGNILADRRQRITSDLDKAREYKAKTEAAIAAYEKALNEARAKAAQIGQATRDQINAEIEQERRHVEQKIAAMTTEAEARIARSQQQALAQVNAIAGATAHDIVQHIAGLSGNDQALTAAVNEVLQTSNQPAQS